MNTKLRNLINILKEMESAVLAYSGGADSTFLLKAMQLSGMRAAAITADSEIMPRHELLSAIKTVRELGIRHRVVESDELSIEEFVRNTPRRCYICKDNRFKLLKDIAISERIEFVIDGSNVDDTMDYRPGREAAKVHNVRSPLIEAGFSKTEIREVSRQLGLSTWDRPSSPCLSTRIPYGLRITIKALKRVEKAEDFLRSFGLRQIRVRDHGNTARIEIEEDKIALFLAPENRKLVSETLKSFGYKFISLDLDEYKSGSMNRVSKGRNSL